MNAEQLLAHYARIAEAPDAIAQMRRFVLDLAVRGKLVEQDPTDEPAIEQLLRIETEKERLTNNGEIKARKINARERQEPLEFSPPHGWALTDLGTIAIKITDGAHKTPTYVDRGVPFVSVKDFSAGQLSLSNTRFIPESEHQALYQRCDPRRGDILLGRIGTLGKAVLVETDEEFSLFVSVGLIRIDHENVCAPFIRLLLNSPFVEEEFDRIKIGGGTHTNKLNLGDLHTVALPLPPLAEQHRIVAKVHELMALCDRLDEASKEREAVRDRLTAASLARLNAPDPDPATFTTHARFALDNLPALTTRADQIKQLRQTILNLAVRGKLVKQDPSEPPAKAFWKSRLGAEAEQANQQREVPFECPTGWCWTTVQQTLATHREISYGVIKLGDEPKVGGVSTLRCSDVRPGLIELSGVRKVREEIEADYARTRLRGGEIVINIRGTLGGVALVPDTLEGFNVAREVAVVPIAPEISGSFMVYTMLSPFFWDYIQSNLRGIAYKGLNLGILRNLPIPFPPIVEQSRIVTKVDALMALCDQLESSLATGDEIRQRLLEAVLHETLEPAEVRELEAA